MQFFLQGNPGEPGMRGPTVSMIGMEIHAQ